MYPHLDGVLSLDLTTVLILNQLANSEQYGAVYLVNLFSNIKTPANLKHIKESYDEHTNIHLMKAISESDTVILAYGAYAKRPVVVERVEQVMEMLKPHKRKSKSLLTQQQMTLCIHSTLKHVKMDIEIKGGLSMNHKTTQSDWRTVASCLASQNYISIIKGLVYHFTAIEDEEILDKIYDDFMNDDAITTILNNDLQIIINQYLSK